MLDLPNTAIIEGNAVRWGRIGKGPPLVAIHGTPFSSQVWRRIVPHFADRRTVYYFDLVGYGLSEMREGQDVSLAAQNKVLAALFAEWGLERPDVLAHDFGGATALRAYLQTAAHNPLSEEALTIYSAPWLGSVGQPAFYRQIAQMDQRYTDEVEARYSRMECPVTVLWGQKDDWIPYVKGEALAGLISDQSLIPIPDAGHLVQEDCPEVLVAAVLKSFGGT